MIAGYRVKLSLLCLYLAYILTGCSSTVNTKYYQLTATSAMAERSNVTNQEHKTVVIGPLFLPEYLNRSQIVMRSSDTELVLATGGRWAEPLQENLTRVLIQNLNPQLEAARVFAFTHYDPEQASYRITLDIQRFDGDTGGDAGLSTQWTLIDGKSRKILSQGSFDYTTTFNPEESSFGGYTRALSRLVSDLSDDLSEIVNSIE